MHWITPALALALASTLACGDPPKTTDSGSGDTTHDTHSSGTSSSSSSGTSAATEGGGSGSASEGQTSSTTHNHTTTSTSGPETTTTGSTGHDTHTTGSTGHDSSTGHDTEGSTGGSSGGGVCQMPQQSCAMGEKCCPGLECCAGIPVPPGKEFCAQICPVSDRNAKTDLRAIDPQDVLRKVAALDITTWRYKKDAEGVRHLGPMAQDFRAAFGLWDTDTMIFPLDATGVSMAAIQGLYQRLTAAEAENDDLRGRLARLEQRLAELEAR